MRVNTSIETNLLCPSCGGKGRTVKPITIETLVSESARTQVGRQDGFRFCANPSCDVVYYRPESGQRIHRHDVNVHVGQKETAPPRMVCYCFHHTVEEIEAEVNETGTSRVLDSIAEKCRQGLDRCEETNPQGACCLGNVRSALKDAQAKLLQTDWDLIVCDESHKLSATYFGNEVKYTKRYRLGQLLSTLTRNFLLLTATPHNGKEADFQLFLALLDGDRFEGKFRDGVHATDAADMMRRLVKEQLLKFDGTPLFPERRAYTVNYSLSDEIGRAHV